MRRIHTIYSLICFVFLLLTIGGCARLGSGFEQPSISVSNMRAGKISPLETVFILDLRIMNPNDFPLDIRGLNCKLQVNGRHFATGLSNTPQSIPAYDTAILPVTVYASMFDMATSVIQLLQHTQQVTDIEPLHYQLAGTVRLERYGAYDFTTDGEVTLTGQGQ